MFEDYTYEALLQGVLDKAPDNIDTRQGSIFYDAVSGIMIKVAKLYTDLDLVFSLTQIATSSGTYLEQLAADYFGLTRNAATAAQYYFVYEGTTPSVGTRFFTDGAYFLLAENDDGDLILVAEEAGASGNGIYEGTAAVPVNNISGLVSASFGEIYIYGEDAESDDDLRERMQEKLTNPTGNGNKQDYKEWCESVSGVSLAKIYPLWNGPNTVKAVLINAAGLPCNDSIVAAVQEYVDPATEGKTATVDGREYVVGDGLGEGVANIGSHFTACAPEELTLNISFSAELQDGYTSDEAQAEAETAISAYLSDLVLNSEDEVVIRVTAIGAALLNLASIVDYSEITINGSSDNITVGEDYIAICGEVTVSAV